MGAVMSQFEDIISAVGMSHIMYNVAPKKSRFTLDGGISREDTAKAAAVYYLQYLRIFIYISTGIIRGRMEAEDPKLIKLKLFTRTVIEHIYIFLPC